MLIFRVERRWGQSPGWFATLSAKEQATLLACEILSR